jgi:predicted CXXCH cytochrome family protein
VTLGTLAALWFRPSPGEFRRARVGSPTHRARKLNALAARSPYSNVRSGVEYVGDFACARCHQEIAEAYRQHPMGRSLTPIAEAPLKAEGGPDDRGSFESDGFEYQVERIGGRLMHKEVRRDRWGRVLTEVEAEVRYVVGSGTQTYSFLVGHDGYLFESPISWYSKVGRWGLSPGYQAENHHFQRPITAGCLFCHANRFDPLEGTLNHYRPSIFEGHSIGCERCHGPGESHVKSPFPAVGQAPNIVNPSDLSPALREDVCRQCHLQGDERVERAGLTRSDYRPGLPLSEFESVFTRISRHERKRFFGQVEQLNESRCFQASGGRMGCVSCHDPHRKPSETEVAAFFRGRCLNCHAETPCRLPARERGPDDSCIACHMPRSSGESVPHTAATDHTIPRRLGVDQDQGAAAFGFGLVQFGGDRIVAEVKERVERDLGIALTLQGRKLPAGPASESCRRGLERLDRALVADPDDAPAWWAKGDALQLLDRPEEALEAFRAVLGLTPDDELGLMGAASAAARLARSGEALIDVRRALAINPWRADYHHLAGVIHLQDRDWPAAAAACKKALELDPANIRARMALIEAYLRMGRRREARDEYAVVLGYEPPDVDAIRRWYAGRQ